MSSGERQENDVAGNYRDDVRAWSCREAHLLADRLPRLVPGEEGSDMECGKAAPGASSSVTGQWWTRRRHRTARGWGTRATGGLIGRLRSKRLIWSTARQRRRHDLSDWLLNAGCWHTGMLDVPKSAQGPRRGRAEFWCVNPGACFEGGGRITRDVIYYIVTNITVMGVTDEVL